ncbi:MAG TPA: hypothetical protein VFW48_06235, partial [Solirubrobacterales bacterium]|nr:hypothetical protein [Solirubrobacterales bacterium]
MARRTGRFPFTGLNDEEFEEFAFLVAHMELPGLVKTANPDGGLDGLIFGKDGKSVPRGIQAKRFTGTPSWTKCVKSLDDAVETYAVEHVTFIFARDLTTKQIEAFQEKLISRHPGVRVDYWSAGQLTGMLVETEEGRRIARHTFGEGELEKIERLVRAGHDVDSGARALETLGAVGEKLSGDPYFDYSVGSRPAKIAGQPPSEGTTIRIEV